VDALVEAGIKVQLDHDEKETNFQDHGWVKISHDAGEGSKVIAESAMFQHNRNYHARSEMIPDLVEQVLAHCNAAVPKENKGPENSTGAEAKSLKPSKQLSKEKRVSAAGEDEPGSPMKKTRGANKSKTAPVDA